MNAEDYIIEAFYNELDLILSKIPKSDKILLLGDFNARVGRDHNIWKGTKGKNGMANRTPLVGETEDRRNRGSKVTNAFY